MATANATVAAAREAATSARVQGPSPCALPVGLPLCPGYVGGPLFDVAWSDTGGTVGISVEGRSRGTVGVSALGETDSFLLAVSPTRDAHGPVAISGLGHAGGQVAVSALGSAGDRCGILTCNLVAVSGTGDAQGGYVASGTGDATGYAAVSGTGRANGSNWSVSGCQAAEGLGAGAVCTTPRD